MDEIGRKFRELEILASNILMAAGKRKSRRARFGCAVRGAIRGEKGEGDDLKPYVNWNFTN